MTDSERIYFLARKNFYAENLKSMRHTLELCEKNGWTTQAMEYRIMVEEYEQALKFYTMKLED